MKTKAAVALALTLCASASCAVTQDLTVNTHPPGAAAEALINGRVEATCTAPCVLTLPQSDRIVLRFTKDGYHPRSIVLGSVIGDAPPFFSHWSFYIPPVLVIRAVQYLTQGVRGAYNRLVGLPGEVMLVAEGEDVSHR